VGIELYIGIFGGAELEEMKENAESGLDNCFFDAELEEIRESAESGLEY
jgi:hypothetical protein